MYRGDCKALCGPFVWMHMADDDMKVQTVKNGRKSAVHQKDFWSCGIHGD